MRSVKVYEETWPLHTPFVIARGSRSEAHVVVVELEEEDVKGIGECTPYPRYGESDASVMAQIMSIVPQLENGLTREALQKLLPAGAARNAVDSALWDLQARQKGATLLKIKLDARLISERMVAIRSAVPEATLIVDANESWRPEGLAARCQLLADLNVAMLEQPLPAQDDAALENFIPREQGFGLMLGCMLCTSRAISAALPLMPQVSFADLDGPTWLAVDVEPALRFTTGQLHL